MSKDFNDNRPERETFLQANLRLDTCETAHCDICGGQGRVVSFAVHMDKSGAAEVICGRRECRNSAYYNGR